MIKITWLKSTFVYLCAHKKPMLRYIATILLLVAFTTQTFHKVAIVLGYYTNTTTFAAKCENKARPQLRCKGKCQMMKKLEAEEKKEAQNPDLKADTKVEVLSSKSYFTTSIITISAVKTIYPATANSSACTGVARSIFHPPGLS